MPWNVRLLHGKDLLDEAAPLQSGRRQSQGQVRRGEQGGSGQCGQSEARGQEVALLVPAETLQPGAQTSRLQRPRLPGTVAQLLREEPSTGNTGQSKFTVLVE